MDTSFMPLEKLISLKENIKNEIIRKEEKINDYIQYRLRKYLNDNNVSNDEKLNYILKNIEVITLTEQYLYCKIHYLEKGNIKDSKHIKSVHTNCEIYTLTYKTGQVDEHIKCRYKKNERSCDYDFCSNKVLHSEKHSISRQGFDQLLNFSKWLSKKGIFSLLDDLWKIKQSTSKYPILETRDACLTFLMCCKFGGLPLSRDTSRLIAQKLWETRYQ